MTIYYLSPKQARAYLNISNSYLINLELKGKIKTFKNENGRIFIVDSEVDYSLKPKNTNVVTEELTKEPALTELEMLRITVNKQAKLIESLKAENESLKAELVATATLQQSSTKPRTNYSYFLNGEEKTKTDIDKELDISKDALNNWFKSNTDPFVKGGIKVTRIAKVN
ncbi:MAG: hypothetical protein ACRC2R_01235 [Xenococcaceae cyanobacterium]